MLFIKAECSSGIVSGYFLESKGHLVNNLDEYPLICTLNRNFIGIYKFSFNLASSIELKEVMQGRYTFVPIIYLFYISVVF